MATQLRKAGDQQFEAARYAAQDARRQAAARTHYLSHGERFDRMVTRYTIARREGRFQAAAAIKRAANRIVDEMPI